MIKTYIFISVITFCSITIQVSAQTNNNSVQIEEIKKSLQDLDNKFNQLLQQKEILAEKLKLLEDSESVESDQETSASTTSANLSDENEQTESPVKKPKIDENVNSASLDLAVPEVPALAVLGLTTQEVIRPTTPREFATELLNGIDRNGNFQSGVAIDTVPWLFFLGDTSLNKYRESYPTQLLLNNAFSFATTKGSSNDDKSVRVAVGVRFVPWNLGDPRTYKLTPGEYRENGGNKKYWIDNCFESVLDPLGNEINSILEIMKSEEINRDKCVTQKIKSCEFTKEDENRNCQLSVRLICDQEIESDRRNNQERISSLEAQMDEKLREGANQCRKELRKLTWNRSAWAIGVAPTWISPNGNIGDTEWDGLGLWTSFAYGFEGIPTLERTSQFILHARYRTDEEVPIEDMDNMFIEQDSFFLGGRLIVGKPTIAAQFEGGYTFSDPRDGDNENSFIGSLGGNIMVRDNLWLDLSIGAMSGAGDKDSQVFVLNSLKWGFQNKPTIIPAGN